MTSTTDVEPVKCVPEVLHPGALLDAIPPLVEFSASQQCTPLGLDFDEMRLVTVVT